MTINDRYRNGNGPIVVGIDGSSAGLEAMAWAVQEAATRGCPVEVVHAWDNVPLPGAMFTSASELSRASECFVANECAAAAEGLAAPPAFIQTSRQGSAAKVLIERSAGAAMLVVGRGAHHAVKDVLARSVSAACVRGALCPVVVVNVPGGRADTEPAAPSLETGQPLAAHL